LRGLGFYSKIAEDIIDAIITKDTQQNLREKLVILGKLTVLTKQMDVLMEDDEAVGRYLEEFLREAAFPLGESRN